uniref:Uncharacterized protein n=1 Tax=Anguilla anguilla TaxID=7936 RepID=A0A0E9RVH9_ANGAN
MVHSNRRRRDEGIRSKRLGPSN